MMYEFDIDTCLYDFDEKRKCLRNIINEALLYSSQMFTYDGLPDSIDNDSIEVRLQTHGYLIACDVRGNLYFLNGGLGGLFNEVNRPTKAIVNSPYLNYNEELEIGKSCELLKCDNLIRGLLPIFRRYGTALVENELSMQLVEYNTRAIDIFVASDTQTKTAVETYLKQIRDGKQGVVVADNNVIQTLELMQSNIARGNEIIKPLIEYEQYLRATMYNSIGLNANYNMKREALNSSESALNDDILTPLLDNMLSAREESLEKINRMFGTNITVKLNSAWKDNREELKKELSSIDEREVAEDEKEAD